MLKRAVVALVFLVAASGHMRAQDSRATSLARAFQQDAARDDAAGVVKPVVLQSRSPTYTAEAMRVRVQGSVDVQVVVGVDGSVVRARVVKVAWSGEGDETHHFTEATPGLIANALTAAKASTFRPGTLNGSPAAVMTTMTLTFRLH